MTTTMPKRIGALLLAIVMIFSLFPVTAFADENNTVPATVETVVEQPIVEEPIIEEPQPEQTEQAQQGNSDTEMPQEPSTDIVEQPSKDPDQGVWP